MVTTCFICKSRHTTKLAMYVNRTMLEAAGATIRSDHLDALARLCEEKSLEDQDIHPLDNYHLEPAEATVTAASITADAGSDQKSRQWFKKGNRRYPDRQPRTDKQVTWIKMDGQCATYNKEKATVDSFRE